jgi:glutamate racemase
VPVVGVIEPGAGMAVRAASVGRRVGVIATEATVRSGAYRRAIRELAPEVEVIERACPLFVALAEEGWAETDVARTVAQEYLTDFAAGASMRSCSVAHTIRFCVVSSGRHWATRFV